MATQTFKRHELKYVLDPVQYRQMRLALEPRMQPDDYSGNGGMYMIYNLYFDTENDDVIRRSSAGPVFKEKLRLRSYRLPISHEDAVYLELKRKFDGVVSKRRAAIAYGEAERFIACGYMPQPVNYVDRQVMAEIEAFLSRNPARPKLYLSYERLALCGSDMPSLRVTFDRNILTRRERVDFLSGDYGTDLLENDETLMEIKICEAMPLWLAQTLSRLDIHSTGFSKYGEEYRLQIEKQALPPRTGSMPIDAGRPFRQEAEQHA